MPPLTTHNPYTDPYLEVIQYDWLEVARRAEPAGHMPYAEHRRTAASGTPGKNAPELLPGPAATIRTKSPMLPKGSDGTANRGVTHG